MGEVLEAAAGPRGELLGAGQVLAAVSQGFGFLLQKAEFLQVVRRQADQMALAGDRDLQRLANPPGRVGGEAGAVADVEAVDGLHQAADGFLQQVGIAEGVVPEALGDVGGQADVGGSQAMLAVDVAVVDRRMAAICGFLIAIVADELGHGPGFQGGTMARASLGKWRIKTLTSSLLHSQKSVEKFAFFFGGERSEEKIVVVGVETSLSSSDSRRLRFGAFIAINLPLASW